MANRRYNTQIRKKFDNGSEKPIKRGGLNFKTPAQKSRERSKKQFNPSDYNITSAGGTKKPGKQIDKNPGKNMSDKDKANLEKAAERRRLFNEKRKLEKQQKQIDQLKRKRTSKAKLPARPIEKPKKNTIKDKLKKVGNMKVKDAAKVVGKAALAATPVGLAKKAADTVNKNFKFQSPIVSRKNRKFGGR